MRLKNTGVEIKAPINQATAIFEKKFANDFACSLFKTIFTRIYYTKRLDFCQRIISDKILN